MLLFIRTKKKTNQNNNKGEERKRLEKKLQKMKKKKSVPMEIFVTIENEFENLYNVSVEKDERENI